MIDEIKANILIIGKSGSGKSSLLNYLFGSKVAETGVGGAVTPPGVYKHEFQMNENFMLNIYDTWGLEADKTEKWESLIVDEVRKHDKKEISEWFSTIFYCFNINSNLVEEFELHIIKMLREKKNEVIPVLTHCKSAEDEVCARLTKRIKEKTGIEEENIICVNSVEQTLLSGKKLVCFGKKQIFEAVKRNIWENLWNKIPYNFHEYVQEQLTGWEIKQFAYIEKELKGFGKNKKEKEIAKNVVCSYRTLQKDIVENINEKIQDVNEYYLMLCDNFGLEMGLISEQVIFVEVNLRKKSYYRKKVKKMLENYNLKEKMTSLNSDNDGIIQSFLIKMSELFAGIKDRKNVLKENLNDLTFNANREINEEIDRVIYNFKVNMKYMNVHGE